MNDPYMESLAAGYRRAKADLFSHRDNIFQHRMLVRVNHQRYHGLGVVAIDHTCPPDQVPVLLGNGNVWWYPVESVAPADEPMPKELRHKVLERAGIHHL